MVSEQNKIEDVGFQKNSFSNMGGYVRERMEMIEASLAKKEKREKIAQDKLDETNKADLNLGTYIDIDAGNENEIKWEKPRSEEARLEDRKSFTYFQKHPLQRQFLTYAGVVLVIVSVSVLIYKKFKK